MHQPQGLIPSEEAHACSVEGNCAIHALFALWLRGLTMPRYYFTIRSCDQEHEDERCAVLQDVAAAVDHACRIVRELSVSGYTDPGLLVSVRNEMGEIVLSVPFLAACA
jgi:hypothetical protein